MFKGYAYLPDGKPYLTYDHNGLFQEHFYNQMGTHSFVKDHNGSIIKMDSVGMAKPSLKLNAFAWVEVWNNMQDPTIQSPRIVKVVFKNLSNSNEIVNDLIVIPQQKNLFEIPVGTYRVDIVTDKAFPVAKVGSTTQAGGASGAIFNNVVITAGATPLSIFIGNQ